MPRTMVRMIAVMLGFGLLAVLAPLDAAPPAKKEKKSAEKAARTTADILKALGENVKCEYLDMAIKDAVDNLAGQTGLRIKLDQAFLGPQGGEIDNLTISFQTDGMPLRKALRKMFESYHFSHGVVGDTVWISTEEGVAARQLRQFVQVEFEEVPLQKVLSDLSTKYALNLVLDPKARKAKSTEPVSLKLEDASLETVLRLTSEMVGLKPVRVGSVVYITTEERADKMRDGDTLVPAIPVVPERGNDNGPGGGPVPGVMLNGAVPVPIPPVGPGNNENPPPNQQENR